MKTWISDTFPLGLLECQYFDICKSYDSTACKYGEPCEMGLRKFYRRSVESYVGKKNLEFQIQLIIEGETNDTKT